MIAYDAGEGCVEPSVETAQDDSYGLVRPLFIYVKRSSLDISWAVTGDRVGRPR